jgi:hypothetical protein
MDRETALEKSQSLYDAGDEVGRYIFMHLCCDGELNELSVATAKDGRFKGVTFPLLPSGLDRFKKSVEREGFSIEVRTAQDYLRGMA